MSYFMVDVEADGPVPGDYSMVCFGVVLVEPSLSKTFYGKLRPISQEWIPEALQVSGFSREQTLAFDDPKAVMQQFATWLRSETAGQPMFISDNNFKHLRKTKHTHDPIDDARGNAEALLQIQQSLGLKIALQ